MVGNRIAGIVREIFNFAQLSWLLTTVDLIVGPSTPSIGRIATVALLTLLTAACIAATVAFVVAPLPFIVATGPLIPAICGVAALVFYGCHWYFSLKGL